MADPARLSWWKKALFALVPVAFLLLAVEIALRIWAPPWTVFENHVPPVYERHASWGYRYSPGAAGEMVRNREIRSRVEIGRHGWRGPAPAPLPGPGVYRVVVVGDSHTAGLEVGEGETFPAALDRALEEKTGRRVEALNLGLDGSGTDIQRLVLEDEGFGFGPHLVLLQVFHNDFRDTGRPLAYREVVGDSILCYQTEEERADLLERAGKRKRSILRMLARISYTARGIRFLRQGGVPDNFLVARSWYEERTTWEPLPERVAAVAAEIEAMAGASREAGVSFAVLAVPASWILQKDRRVDRHSYAASHLASPLGERGIPLLDLRPAMLRATPDAADLAFRTDSHPNPHGYRVMADAAADWLVGEGLISPSPGTE